MAPMQYEYYQAVRGPALRAFLEDRFSALATTDDSGASTLVPSSPMPSQIEAPRRRHRRLASGSYVEPAEDDPFSDAESEKEDSKPSENVEPQPDAEPADPSATSDPLGRLRASVMVRQMNLQFRLMQQRKVCQHPYLFDFPVQDPLDPESEYLVDEQLVRSSGKLLVLDRLLPALFKEGHRAQDRVHRIGQKSPVIIYRLIIAGSCEKAMLQRAKGKRRLEKLVIHEKKFKGLQKQESAEKAELSIGDIAQILMDDDDELVDKDQRELKKILENLGPDDQIPADAVLSEDELRTLTDRAPEAYLKKKIVDSGRFKQMETAVDDQNDLLATIKA
ncbi:putative ATPase [Coemansia sp. RSA 486]|nr:putative ATPase [Coemansia sp. RSA 486]